MMSLKRFLQQVIIQTSSYLSGTLSNNPEKWGKFPLSIPSIPSWGKIIGYHPLPQCTLIILSCQKLLGQLDTPTFCLKKNIFLFFLCIKTGGCCDTVRVVAPTSDPAALAEDISGVYRLNDSMSGKELDL